MNAKVAIITKLEAENWALKQRIRDLETLAQRDRELALNKLNALRTEYEEKLLALRHQLEQDRLYRTKFNDEMKTKKI